MTSADVKRKPHLWDEVSKTKQWKPCVWYSGGPSLSSWGLDGFCEVHAPGLWGQSLV